MTTLLIAPGHNRTPRAATAIDTRNGVTRVALNLDIRFGNPAVRWYTATELKTINTAAEVESVIRDFENLMAMKAIRESSGGWQRERDNREWNLDYLIGVALGRIEPLVQLTPELMKHVNASAYVNLVTVYHPAFFNEAA